MLRFDAIECDLQVKDLRQGVPEDPIITPQCLFKSRTSKFNYKAKTIFLVTLPESKFFFCRYFCFKHVKNNLL